MVRPGAAVAAVAVALLLVCVGCTSTTGGNGSAVRSGSAGTTSPPGATATDTGPGPGGTTNGSPATGGPSPVPAPAACPGGTCRQNMSTTLMAPFAVIVRNGSLGGADAAVVELTRSDVPVSWYVVQAETPSEITCSSTPTQSNCVLVDHVGAGRSDAILFRVNGDTLHRGSTVAVSTPQTHALDLNGDGWVDVAGLQNTGVAGSATGKLYWQTWSSDGVRLGSTGCTSPAATAEPEPTALLRGNCP